MVPQLQTIDTASLRLMAAEEKLVQRKSISKKNTRADSLEQDSRNIGQASTDRTNTTI